MVVTTIRMTASAAAAQPIATTRTTASTITTTTTTRGGGGGRRKEQQLKLPTLLPRPQPLPINTERLPLTFHHHPLHPSSGRRPKFIESDHRREEEEEEENMATATDILRLMDGLRLPVGADLYASLLKECTDARDASRGAEVHAHILRRGGGEEGGSSSSGGGLLLANRLLLMYVACGQLYSARELFEDTHLRNNFVSWATMIAGLSDAGEDRAALQLFAEMMTTEGEGAPHVAIISSRLLLPLLVAVLQSCARLREVRSGESVHGLAAKMGRCPVLKSSLIRFYGAVGRPDSAQRVFHCTRFEGDMGRTDMVVTCCRAHLLGEALLVFREIRSSRARRRRRRRRGENILYSSIFRACGDDGREEGAGSGGCCWGGRQVHADAVKIGLDPLVQSRLVEMYGRCGLLREARKAFLPSQKQDVLVASSSSFWNAME